MNTASALLDLQALKDHVAIAKAATPSRAAAVPNAASLDEIDRQANLLSNALQAQRLELFPPEARRTFREIPSAEVAALLGIPDAYLRKLEAAETLPAPKIYPNGKRTYSVADLHTLRQTIDQSVGEAVLSPQRKGNESLQVFAVANFKGGSAKTTTSAHLCQYLALHGYRVLAIDMDPQASLSALHGIQPEWDVKKNQTIYGAIRYDDERVPFESVIRETHIPGLHIVPANLEVMEFEHTTPAHLTTRRAGDPLFFDRVTQAILSVQSHYDVVIIDCPPQLGYLAMSAMCAASGVIVTVHPQMLDIMSMSQFLLMMSDIMRVVSDAGGSVDYSIFKYVITRFEPRDAPQTGIVNFLRHFFPQSLMENSVLKSTAISDAGLKKQTLYECNREEFSRNTYDRAIESLNAVNGEIESLIKINWGRV